MDMMGRNLDNAHVHAGMLRRACGARIHQDQGGTIEHDVAAGYVQGGARVVQQGGSTASWARSSMEPGGTTWGRGGTVETSAASNAHSAVSSVFDGNLLPKDEGLGELEQLADGQQGVVRVQRELWHKQATNSGDIRRSDKVQPSQERQGATNPKPHVERNVNMQAKALSPFIPNPLPISARHTCPSTPPWPFHCWTAP